MKISIVVPFHKDISNLHSSCKSINDQILPKELSLEIVIGNDSEYSDEYIKSYLSEFINKKIKVLVNKNIKKNCAGYARNAAIEISTGEYIAFLDSDDKWSPIKLLMQLKFILRNYDFITCAYSYDEGKVNIYPPKKINHRDQLFFDWHPIGTSTVVISRRILKEKKFSELTFCQDILFWSDLFSERKIKYAAVNYPLVNYSTYGRTSKTKIKTSLKYYFIAARRSGLSLLLSSLSLLNYSLRGIYSKVIKKNIYPHFVSSNKFFLIKIIKFIFLSKIYLFQSLSFDIRYGLSKSIKNNFNLSKNNYFFSESIQYFDGCTDLILESLHITSLIYRILKIPENRLQFINLGSGFGKTMCVVALFYKNLYRSNPILGVETSQDLTNIANTNLSKFLIKQQFHIAVDDFLSVIKTLKEKIYIIYITKKINSDYLQEISSKIFDFKNTLIVYFEPIDHSVFINSGFKLIYSHKSLLSIKNREFNIYINS